MLVRVGRAFGRLPHELRDVPLHWLMWDYFHLRDAMRADDIIAERDRVREGVLAAFAFHEPKRLSDEERKVRARALAFDRGDVAPGAQSDAELVAFARRMQGIIDAKGVLDDAPVVS